MAYRTPSVHNDILTYQMATREQQIQLESSAWWAWLEDQQNTTFRFVYRQDSFTARCEYKRSGYYWYAYRKHQGQLHKAYLGKAPELSITHLRSIATSLAAQIAAASLSNQAENLSPTLLEPPERHDYPPQPLLFTAKLFLPQIRAGLFPRPQLMAQLDATLQNKLTLLSAPAGFGKSTILSAWCHAQQSPILYTWLSLDAGDNDPARFWLYVSAALQKLSPTLAGRMSPLLQTTPFPAIETLLATLLNALPAPPLELILVLDDYHVIENPVIHTGLTFLLNHLPANFHLILASRSDPPLPLIHLRAQNQLQELRTSELRFNSTEVSLFLRQTQGLLLSSQEIATLAKRTEGWAVGLQLAALSLRGQQENSTFIATFGGSHRYILDYLSSEIFARQPEHIRDFLLQTSILERLNASLCNAVTLRSDGQTLLEMLEQANLFLIPLDERRQWYRYHHLFAEFLSNHLQALYPEQISILHRRAAQWYEQYGLLSVTIDHALATADMAYVAQLVDRFAEIMMQRGEMATFLRWLALLPKEQIHANPHLHIAQAGAFIAVGQLNNAESCLEDIAVTLQQLPASDRLTLEADFFNAAGALAAFRSDLPRTIELSHKALALIPQDNFFMRGMNTVTMGIAYMLSGDLERARSTFEEAVSLSMIAHNYHVIIVGKACLGYIQVIQGHLHAGVQIYHQAVSLGTRQKERLFSVVSIAYVYLSEVLYEWNDLAAAEQCVQKGIALGPQWGFIGVLAQGYNILARIQFARGHRELAFTTLQQAEQVIQGQHIPYITTLTASYRAQMQILSGDPAGAHRWSMACNPQETLNFSYPNDVEYLVFIQLCIAQRQFGKADMLIESSLSVIENEQRTHNMIDCFILRAVLLYEQDQREQALTYFVRALALAEEEGYIRTFLDKGKPIANLLDLAASHNIAPSYVHKLLLALHSTAKSADSSVMQLSTRELLVLQCLAAGKSNQQIAQEFVVALSTVKTHLNNIYSKLSVHSRTQALARARLLGLLA